MNATDVIGYVDNDNCVTLCPDCCEDPDGSRYLPIFATEEFDCPQHCDTCDEIIPVKLTDAGAQYVRDALQKFVDAEGQHDNGDTLEDWLDQYNYAVSTKLACLFRRWYDGADIVIRIHEEMGHHLFSFAVDYDDDLGEDSDSIYRLDNVEDYTNLVESGVCDLRKPREFVTYLQKDLGLIPAKMQINNIDVRRS